VGREWIKYSIANDDTGINLKNRRRRREYGKFFGHLPASVCTLRDGPVSVLAWHKLFPTFSEALKNKNSAKGRWWLWSPFSSLCKRAVTTFFKVGKYGSVGIAIRYGLDGQGSITGRDRAFFCTPQRPNWFWGPPSILHNGCRSYRSRGVELTTHLHLFPKSRMLVELYLHSLIRLRSVVLK
jgi:hypothetical protein